MSEAVASAGGRERPIGFVGLMRNRNYALLWWGQLVSEVGNRFHWVAISLWVYSVSGSAGAVSLAVASMFAGSLLVGLWAGVLVDRWDRKSILVGADLLRSVLVALIPSLMNVSLWLVYTDLILISSITAFFRPAIFAAIPASVPPGNLLVANSFFTAMETGTEIVGPALAGVIAFSSGYAPLLYLDAGTYAISALCMLGLSWKAATQRSSATSKTMMDELLEAFRYIRRDPLQRQLFLLIFPGALVGAGLNSLQTPLAKGVVGIDDAEFGTFQSVWGMGFLVASLMLGWFGSGFKKSVLVVSGFFLMFVSAAGMGLSKTFGSLLVSGFGVGFSNTMHYVGMGTILMMTIPGGLVGRVIAVRQVAVGMVRVLAPVLFGLLADVVGVRVSVLLMTALGAVGTSLVFVGSRSVWEVNGGWTFSLSERFRTLRVAFGSVAPEFDSAQQVRLNLIVLLLALAAVTGVGRASLRDVLMFAVGAAFTAGGVLVLARVRGGSIIERVFANRPDPMGALWAGWSHRNKR